MRVLEVGNNVFQLRFLPDGRRLLVGTAREEQVRRGWRRSVAFAVWSLTGGAPVRLRLAESEEEEVTQVSEELPYLDRPLAVAGARVMTSSLTRRSGRRYRPG